MRRAWGLWLCLLAGVAAVSLAGDIQVTCEPGLRVYLDGKLAGTSSAKDDGLFLAGVPEGKHTFRIEKDGFAPQLFAVEVGQLPFEVKAQEFSPAAPARPDREESTEEIKRAAGEVLVTSAPQDCVVEIDGKTEVKSTPLLRIAGLAPGEHRISFSKGGYDPVSGVFSVRPGAEITIRGDLKTGKVETVSTGKGSLRVISTPEHCNVLFLGKTREKTRARLNLSFIPAGEHLIVVEWGGRKLSTTILITNGYRTIVTVSFLKGDKPFVVSYEPL
jgi:hypothetical protein